MVGFDRLLPILLLYLSPFRPSTVAADLRYDHLVLGTSMTWPDPYDPRAVIHSRFQVTRGGRVIMASPRFRPGVPFTLGSFRVTAARRAVVEPDVRPLPPAPQWHRVPATTIADSARASQRVTAVAAEAENGSLPLTLINVVDLCLDVTKDVLWLLDVGVVDTMTDSPKRVAPAKIVRLEIDDDDDEDDSGNYNPTTYEIKPEVARHGGEGDKSCLQFLVTFRSRAPDGNHYVFVSDPACSAVAVLNTNTGEQWRIDFPERSLVDGATRDIMFMLLLRTANGHSALYVTFMSGCRVYSVDLERLDQCGPAHPSVVEVGRKPYRIVVLGSDTGSRMYFRRPAENEIWSWDVNFPFHPVSFQLVSVGRDCRAPVHVAPGYGGFMFVLANNFADYVRNTTGSLGAYTLVQPVSVISTPVNATTTAAAETTTAAGCDCPE